MEAELMSMDDVVCIVHDADNEDDTSSKCLHVNNKGELLLVDGMYTVGEGWMYTSVMVHLEEECLTPGYEGLNSPSEAREKGFIL